MSLLTVSQPSLLQLPGLLAEGKAQDSGQPQSSRPHPPPTMLSTQDIPTNFCSTSRSPASVMPSSKLISRNPSLGILISSTPTELHISPRYLFPPTPYSHVGSSTQNTHCRVTFFCGEKKHGPTTTQPLCSFVWQLPPTPFSLDSPPSVFSLFTFHVRLSPTLSIPSTAYLSFLPWPTLHILFTTHLAVSTPYPLELGCGVLLSDYLFIKDK